MPGFQLRRATLIALTGATLATLVACSAMPSLPLIGSNKLALTGASEVPPVTTSATGAADITINSDRTVTGSISTTGINGTMAHIHEAATGVNGPVIVPLTKSDTTWVVPAGTKLTESQYASYKAGNLYVNVHSASHPGGEIRAQLKGN